MRATNARPATRAGVRHYAPRRGGGLPVGPGRWLRAGHVRVSYDDCGDAWVKAPDGAVAGLIWETGEPAYFKVAIEPGSVGHLRRAATTAP